MRNNASFVFASNLGNFPTIDKYDPVENDPKTQCV